MPLCRILLKRKGYIKESYIIDPGFIFGSKLLFTSHIIYVQNKALSMFDIIIRNFQTLMILLRLNAFILNLLYVLNIMLYITFHILSIMVL